MVAVYLNLQSQNSFMNRNLFVSLLVFIGLFFSGCQSYGPGEGSMAYGDQGHVAWEHPIKGPFPHTVSHSPDRVTLYNTCSSDWHVDLYEGDRLIFRDMDSRPYAFYPDSPFLNDYLALAVQMYRLDSYGRKYNVRILPARLQVHSTSGWLSAQWEIGNGNSYPSASYSDHNF